MHVRTFPRSIAGNVCTRLLFTTFPSLKNPGILLRVDICGLVFDNGRIRGGKDHARGVLLEGGGSGSHLGHLSGWSLYRSRGLLGRGWSGLGIGGNGSLDLSGGSCGGSGGDCCGCVVGR